MSVIFKPEFHKYESLDPNENIIWTSVTQFIKEFKPPFDPIAQSIKSSKNKKSKWYGVDPLEIQKIWSGEGERANSTGTFYHGQRESDLLGIDTIQRFGVNIPIIQPIYNNGIKHAPEQRLVEGIYPEHFVYLKSAGICGQSDRVEVIKDFVNIIDYKTNKKIEKEGFKNWEGITQKMLGPCAHLDDCNFNHYALQLSVYLYIILKHNPRLKPGDLILQHVIFEKESEDKYGYPIYKKDHEGNPVVKEVIPYTVPYYQTEVRNMIKYLINKKDVSKN